MRLSSRGDPIPPASAVRARHRRGKIRLAVSHLLFVHPESGKEIWVTVHGMMPQ